jgi:hypothetical protein
MYFLFLDLVISRIRHSHTPSLAIWDKKKIIVAIATGVWGINVIFLIQGNLCAPVKVEKADLTCHGTRHCAGK